MPMKMPALARIGILTIIETEQGDMLSLSNAQIVRIWGEMRKAGFDGNLDYTPDILGFYIERPICRALGGHHFPATHRRPHRCGRGGRHGRKGIAADARLFRLLRQQAFFRHFDAIRSSPPAKE
jgi:hypothetical protein